MSSTSLRTSKRARLSAEALPPGWSCPACTFLNPLSAFKCQMCDTRKGTSTRISSTVDNGAIEVQRSIQQQIQRTKRPHGRRSDSAAGHSDSSRRQTLPKSEADDSSNESWRLLGDSDGEGTSSAYSVASSEDRSKRLAGKHSRPQRRLSPTPSPSPDPAMSTASKATPPIAKSKSPKAAAMDEIEANIPGSSASSCCNSIGPDLHKANGIAARPVKVEAASPSNGQTSSDRSVPRRTEVTVRGVTVVFTDYDPV